MSINRYAKKIDKNQPQIVETLRCLPGVTVDLNHNDLLIGHRGKNFWIELKKPKCVSKKTGKLLESAIRPSQKKLRDEWSGQYAIVSTIEEILDIINEIP